MLDRRSSLHSISDTSRFLITRLSAIGDCILTLPVAHALRARYPRAHIAWVTQEAPAPLLEGVTAIDQLIVVKHDWWKSWQSVLQLRSRLRSCRFDVCIDPQSLTKSSLLAWLSGAKVRIGFARPQGRELSRWLNNLLVKPTTEHVVDRYLELLCPLGIRRPSVSFAMPVCDESARKVTQTLCNHGSPARVALVNPGAGWDSKRWSTERYATVVRHLAERQGLFSIVLWCGDRELGLANEIVSRAAGNAVVAPPTSLVDLREFVRRAAIFIGSDTGPMHLAVAVGTPTVAIYGPTDPRRCGPYGTAPIALYNPSTKDARTKMRSGDNEAMLAISAEQVMAACDLLLQRRPAHVA
jgi:lipopolysaccharide heptosyltransferase I